MKIASKIVYFGEIFFSLIRIEMRRTWRRLRNTHCRRFKETKIDFFTGKRIEQEKTSSLMHSRCLAVKHIQLKCVAFKAHLMYAYMATHTHNAHK